MKTIHSLDAGNCNSTQCRRCRDPNSENTDFRRAAQLLVVEAAAGSDSTTVEEAVAEQTLTAAADGMAGTTPWIDSETQ